MKRIVGMIPARYKSSRFPGKPLVELLGKPMIIWVCQLTAKALGKENTYVLTEDQRIVDVVKGAGFQAVMTSDKAQTGTDRLFEGCQKIDADIYINIQGDEPLLNPDDISKIAEKKLEEPNYIINGMTRLEKDEDPENINIPKVIFTEKDQRMVYMSRKALPGVKNPLNKPEEYWKQVCIYAFSKDDLMSYGNYGRKSYIEGFEDIEILRFLELDIPIKMVETTGGTHAVDVQEDVAVVEDLLRKQA